MFYDEMENHVKWKCRLRNVYCPFGCGELVIASKVKGHGNKCPMMIIPCTLLGGCGTDVRRKYMADHEKSECVRRHAATKEARRISNSI